MVKIKRAHRLPSSAGVPARSRTPGSLILGLYDAGRLRPVGHRAGFTGTRKRELRAELAPYETGDRGSADPSR